jgi:c-di-GMP-binding flagellar brake protein YcgR
MPRKAESAENTRRSLRVRVALPVACRIESQDETFVTTSVDLSTSGVGIAAPNHIGRWTPVFLAVGQPEAGLSFECAGRVARVTDGEDGYVWGVQFVGLEHTAAIEVARFIIRRLSRSS